MEKNFMKIFAAAAVCMVAVNCRADNISTLIKSVEDNCAAQNYSQALEDLEWVRKEIVNKQVANMKNLLPEQIDGMKGVAVDEGSVLGISGMSREYKDADNGKAIKISIISGNSAAATNGLGALMQMASSFGAMEAGNSSKVIISKGYKGQFLQDGEDGSGTLTFNLDGGILTVETTGYKDAEMAEKTAKMLDLAKIEASL